MNSLVYLVDMLNQVFFLEHDVYRATFQFEEIV